MVGMRIFKMQHYPDIKNYEHYSMHIQDYISSKEFELPAKLKSDYGRDRCHVVAANR